jgi:hypothetical protein
MGKFQKQAKRKHNVESAGFLGAVGTVGDRYIKIELILLQTNSALASTVHEIRSFPSVSRPLLRYASARGSKSVDEVVSALMDLQVGLSCRAEYAPSPVVQQQAVFYRFAPLP